MLIHKQLVAATAVRLVAAGICGGRVDKDRVQPADGEVLPLAFVHISDSKGHPKSKGPRTGFPVLDHVIVLSIDVYDKAASGEAVKGQLYDASQAILAALLTSPEWLALGEGVDGVDHSYLTPQSGRATTAGLRIDISVLAASSWPPIVTDAFDSLHTTSPAPAAVPTASVTVTP